MIKKKNIKDVNWTDVIGNMPLASDSQKGLLSSFHFNGLLKSIYNDSPDVKLVKIISLYSQSYDALRIQNIRVIGPLSETKCMIYRHPTMNPEVIQASKVDIINTVNCFVDQQSNTLYAEIGAYSMLTAVSYTNKTLSLEIVEYNIVGMIPVDE